MRRNNNKDTKLHKNTVAGVKKWAEWKCDSDGVEDLNDDNKLIAHENIASPTNFMTLIATKNVLKLLQNNNLQLNLDTTYGMT